MRVLHVVQELRRGGAETVVHALIDALLERGQLAEVAAAPGPWSDAFAAVPVHPLPVIAQRPSQLAAGTLALHRALRRARPDVVHCHNPTMALLAALPTWRGRRPPTLVTVHGVDAGDYRRAARILAFSGMEVVACGPGVRTALTDAGSAPTRTILNGIPPAAPAHSRTELRRELGLDPAATVIASVGRLVPLKRHDLAVRAVALLPNVSLLIGGGDDVSALLGAVDAMMLCSRGEGLPLTVLEALAAGTPVVAVAVPGVRELVVHEQDALLCEATPESLAEGLRRVLSDTDLAERLAVNGLRTVRPYSDRRMVEEYLDTYRRLVGETSS
jgi:glycosyltransferase involved in cell wall biosynthesis